MDITNSAEGSVWKMSYGYLLRISRSRQKEA
jgi:hypothetical protein